MLNPPRRPAHLQDRRDERLKAEIEKFRQENPKISEQFADLKRKLTELTGADWEAIPDIGDYTVKKRRAEVGRRRLGRGVGCDCWGPAACRWTGVVSPPHGWLFELW